MAADYEIKKYEVFKLHHTMKRGDFRGHYLSDLIFVGGSPLLVLEWEDFDHGSRPAIAVQIDPQFLHEHRMGGSTHMYEFEIEDPRSFS